MPIKISRILHAGYVFEYGATQILFDPIFETPFSRNCYPFPDVRFDHEEIKKLSFAAVFISHYHDDHCSLESLDYLDRQTPIFIYCVFEELITLIRELGFLHVHSLALDTPITAGPFEVIPRRALDAEVDSMFHVKAAGLNVLNVVDSWIDYATLDQLVRLGPWDMVLWPFQTLREIDVLAPSRAPAASLQLPPEWLEQLKVLNPKYVVPSSCQFVQESWSWYNHALFPITYQQFQSEVQSALPEARVIRMNPSASVVLDKASIEATAPLSWVQPIGEQDVDYEFRVDLVPPPTAEIAQHFAPLTLVQTERVLEYCRHGLLEKFRSMEPPQDPYFERPRLWRLSVYDHKGVATVFHYLLEGSNIKPAIVQVAPLAWTTEIPISKLYAGLEAGESLTSMYVRINDTTFAPAIENEVCSADVVEDPLVRCLFNGVFGAYQEAQLKRLKARAGSDTRSDRSK